MTAGKTALAADAESLDALCRALQSAHEPAMQVRDYRSLFVYLAAVGFRPQAALLGELAESAVRAVEKELKELPNVQDDAASTAATPAAHAQQASTDATKQQEPPPAAAARRASDRNSPPTAARRFARSVVRILGSLAALNVRPTDTLGFRLSDAKSGKTYDELIGSLLDAVLHHSEDLEVAELKGALAALAGLRYQPKDGQPGRLLHAVQAQLARANGGIMASILTHVRDLGLHPGAEWLKSAAKVISSRLRKSWLPPPEAVPICWTLCKLGHAFDSQWLQLFLAQTGPALQGLEPVALAQAVDALSSLGQRPDKKWAQSFAAAMCSKISDFEPPSLARAARAGADLAVPYSPKEFAAIAGASRLCLGI